MDDVLPNQSPAARNGRAAGLSLTLLLAINLFNYLDRAVLAAVVPRIARAFFGAEDSDARTKVGALITAFTISYMIAAPVCGWLADRMSRWTLVGISVILWSLASGASGLAGTFGILMATRALIGVGEAGYGPSAPTIISDLYPVERRGFAMSLFYMAIPLGYAMGYAWGGFFDAVLSWRWAFYAVTPPGILLGVLALMHPRGERAAGMKPLNQRSWRDYLPLLKNRSYLLDTAGMTAMTFAIGGISVWMPDYLFGYRQAGTLEHVTVMFGLISATAGITATILGGWAGDWCRGKVRGAYFVVSGAGILLSVPFVLLMLRTPFPMCWVVIFLAVFFLFFNTGPSNTILANVTSPSVRAGAFALNILMIHVLGDALSPPLLGAIVGGDSQRWNAAFVLVAGVMVLAAGAWMAGAFFLDRDTALVEPAG